MELNGKFRNRCYIYGYSVYNKDGFSNQLREKSGLSNSVGII